MPPNQLLADMVLVAHFGIVVFIIGGLLMILAGNLMAWQWVNRFYFRLLHLAAIAVVVAESWLRVACPLTTVESWLREQDGPAEYSASFIEYWVQRLLFYEAPSWLFTLAYTVFAALVIAAWWYFPPQRRERDG